MSVDEYGNTECRICTNTCDFADQSSGLCCICSETEEEKCEQCEERSTPEDVIYKPRVEITPTDVIVHLDKEVDTNVSSRPRRRV